MKVIEANSRLIADFFGARVLRTIEAGRRHIQPAVTYHAMTAAIRAERLSAVGSRTSP